MSPEVLEAAVAVARKVGYRNVTRPQLAEQLGVSLPTLDNRNIRIRDITATLESRAADLGLTAGDPARPGNRYSGAWADHHKAAILDAAYTLADEQGLMRVRRADIAAKAGVGTGTVSLRWGGLDALRLAVVERARELGNERLVHQAEAMGLT